MKKSRQFSAKHRPIGGDTRGAHCREGHAVICVLPSDDLGLLRLALAVPEEPRGLDGGIIRFTAAGGKEEPLNGRIAQLAQLLSKLDSRDRRAAGIAGSKSQLLH